MINISTMIILNFKNYEKIITSEIQFRNNHPSIKHITPQTEYTHYIPIKHINTTTQGKKLVILCTFLEEISMRPTWPPLKILHRI